MIGIDFGFGGLEHEFWRFLFLMTRIAAALFSAPLFGTQNVPPQIRVILAGALSILVCGWTQAMPPPALLSLPGMVTLAGEVLIGLALGFVVQMAFATPVIAAEMIGAGMGLAIASTADPANGGHSPALGQYFSVVLTVLFFGQGAYLGWIALIVDSYRVFPPGSVWLIPGRVDMILGFASTMFLTAVTMALPVTLILFLIQLVSGIISRTAPALNLFSLGLPAGVLAGIGALIVSAPLVTERLSAIAMVAVQHSAAILVK